MKNLLIVTITATITLGVLWIATTGAGRAEAVECRQWQEQADSMPDFYQTLWQAEQCKAHGMVIDAPVIASCKNDTPTACQERLGDAWEVIHDTRTGATWGEYYPD